MIGTDERLDAAILLIGHTGATSLEIGYLHDDVPSEQAGWYATATYRGAKRMAQDHVGPVEAAEALAGQLVTGGKCRWCHGLSTLDPNGVFVIPGSPMIDGTNLPTERAEIEALGQCLWERHGARWEPGCLHGRSTAPGAPQDRAARRRLAREYAATRHGR